MIKWPFLKLLPSITVHKVMDNDRYIQKYGLTKFSKRVQLIFNNFFEYKFGNFSSMNIRPFLIIHYFCFLQAKANGHFSAYKIQFDFISRVSNKIKKIV